MGNLRVTWETLLALLGGVAVIAGGTKAIIGLFSPLKTLKSRVDKHDQLIDNDNKRIKREEAATVMTISALYALLNHAITGNSVENLKKVRDTLQEYLTTRV